MKIRITYKIAFLDSANNLQINKINPSRVNTNIVLNGLTVGSSVDPDDFNVLMIQFPSALWEKSTLELTSTFNYIESVEFNPLEFNPLEFDTIKQGEDVLVTYKETFHLFGYDLGNNNDISHNPNFEILFVIDYPAIANLFTPNYLFSLTNNLIYYRKPFTGEIYVYNGVAIAPQHNNNVYHLEYSIYDFNNTNSVFGSSKAIVNERAEIDFGQKITIKQNIYNSVLKKSEEVIVAESVTMLPFTIMADKEHFPKFDTAFTSKTNCELCQTVTNESNEVYTHLNYNALKVYYINDIKNYPYAQDVITYQLIDISGVILEEKIVESIAVNNPTIQPPALVSYNPYAPEHSFNFTVPSLGDYFIRVVLKSKAGPIQAQFNPLEFNNDEFYTKIVESPFENNDIKICEETIKIFNCNWYQFIKNECSSYTIKNFAYEDMSVTQQYLELDSKQFVTEGTYTVKPNSELELSLSKDGVYNFLFKRVEDSITYNVIVISSCIIEDCLSNRIISLLCEDPCVKCQEQDLFELNRIALTAYSYFAKLHDEYNFNFYYTALDTSKMTELFDIKNQMDRLSLYCNGCSTSTTSKCNC